jgi:hypothetical protein
MLNFFRRGLYSWEAGRRDADDRWLYFGVGKRIFELAR